MKKNTGQCVNLKKNIKKYFTSLTQILLFKVLIEFYKIKNGILCKKKKPLKNKNTNKNT